MCKHCKTREGRREVLSEKGDCPSTHPHRPTNTEKNVSIILYSYYFRGVGAKVREIDCTHTKDHDGEKNGSWIYAQRAPPF